MATLLRVTDPRSAHTGQGVVAQFGGPVERRALLGAEIAVLQRLPSNARRSTAKLSHYRKIGGQLTAIGTNLAALRSWVTLFQAA